MQRKKEIFSDENTDFFGDVFKRGLGSLYWILCCVTKSDCGLEFIETYERYILNFLKALGAEVFKHNGRENENSTAHHLDASEGSRKDTKNVLFPVLLSFRRKKRSAAVW